MQKEYDQVTSKVLEDIKPTPTNRKKMEALARQLELKVSAACEEFGVQAIVRLEGSVAKDTWLKEDPDLDVFIRLSSSIPRESLGEIALKIARKALEGAVQVERFAEHPYLEGFVDDIRVNIVPCYDAKNGEWLSATDRTPYHTDYINEHLYKYQRDEVRLLKKFMKGIGVYGAEIKVGGFSGYLCELLILHYSSFSKVLQAFSQHKARRTIDIVGYYEHRQREFELLFPELLVVIDPVDKSRNVASAVQPQKLFEFAAASRTFQKTPDIMFFYPPKTIPFSIDSLNSALDNRGSQMVFLTLNGIKAVPDVFWGQLHRTRKALHKLLELSEFKVLKSTAWSKEGGELTVFIFELEEGNLPLARKHLGPPLERETECESFLSKYLENADVLGGPYIEAGRWVVQVKRKFTDSVELLNAKLKDGGRDVGVAELLAKAFRVKLAVIVGSEVKEIYLKDNEFAAFLTNFLCGKPFWLKSNS